MSEIPPPPSYPPPPPPPELLPETPAPASAPQSRALVLVLALIGVLIIAGVVVAATMFANETPVSRDLSEVASYGDLSNQHEQGDIDYPQTPPAGGPHAPAWLDCGVYDEPVRDENAVHDLEHGTVWITYDPDELGEDEVDELIAALPQNGILSPYDGLPSPVVVTVWGKQLELTGADDPRLEMFIERFGDGVTAPEPFASCAGGVTDPGGELPGSSV
ncbi:DUF3105 domain-containing protein [Nocardioides sp. SR21]|uniref:DUF3105 domain-containing protein n=1 Tax=Nocardioides sp. SR21 TaxID=2919501 RepID=UPI001FAB32B3|nr:DUF3105 domain-containing protein [Nocardioides sp. SR21]